MDKQINTPEEQLPEGTQHPEDGRRKRKTYSMPEFLTVSPSPHIKSPDTTATVMFYVLVALVPALAWGVYTFGLRALAVVVISVASCVGCEAAAQFVLKRPITIGDLSAAVTGMLLGMNLPVTVPLWMPVVGAFFAIVVVKQVFGGIGKNFVNPALAARVFLFSWAGDMSAFPAVGTKINSLAVTLTDVDAMTGATPLAAMKAGTMPQTNLFGLIVGNTSGCIGEVSAILLLAGGLFLLWWKVISWQIPVAYLGTVAVISLLAPRISGAAIASSAYELAAGGLILGAFFMATDYSTSPVTPVGRLIYGAGCGILTMLIRYFGSYPEGVSFSILIMNLLVWYIDKVTMPRRFGGKSNG
jgi:electron transport complex protein RnfD